MVIWEDRGCDPFPRRLHATEIWRVQSRCEEQLDLLIQQGASSAQIIHKAGKAVTGRMAKYMALAVKVQCLQLKAAEVGCISTLAESWKASVRVVPIGVPALAALVACGGSMLLGGFVNASRESAAVVARKLVHQHLSPDGYLVLAGEEQKDGVPQ